MNNPQTICYENSKINAKHREILMRPYEHIRQCPLPPIWKKLGRAFNGWYDISENDLKMIEDSFQMQQYCNMIIDDIQNDRKLRDGVSTVHCAFNMANALSAYTYLYMECARRLSKFDFKKLEHVIPKMIKAECAARYLQLAWSASVSCPTEEEYYKMIIKKNESLLTTKIKFMQVISESKIDATRLCEIFGLYFHILEDYSRLKSLDESHNFFCEEVTLARFTFPIIHAIRGQTRDGEKILDILHQRTKDKDVKKYFVTLLERCGSFAYSREILEQLKREALKEIEKMKKNSLIEKFMEEEFDSLLNNENSARATADPNNITSFFSQMDQIQSRNEDECLAEQILKPLTHLDSVSGKNIRLHYIHLIDKWLHVEKEKINLIQPIVYYLHGCTLLIDDIQDSSIFRRGMPCSYKIYGIVHTVITATYMVSLVLDHVIALDNPKATEICLTLFEAAARGQGMEIYWRDNFICPTEDEYREMVLGKAGAAFLILGELMQLFSSTDKNPIPLLTTVGVLFQINDDYQNLTNQFFYDTKGFCEDLTEGKFSFPVVHAVNTHPNEGRIILDILRQRTLNVETLKYCLLLIEKCGSLEYTKTKIKEMTDSLGKELETFGTDISAVQSILTQMNINTI